jgi:citrate lyase alpha subunit
MDVVDEMRAGPGNSKDVGSHLAKYQRLVDIGVEEILRLRQDLSTAIERAAKVADKYAQKAEIRASTHTNPISKGSALDKFEAATEIASSIRSLNTESSNEHD